MDVFICTMYVVSLVLCTLGMYHNSFNANFLQRVALVLLCFWFAWRISLVYRFGWAYPHEPLIATAIALFALGTISKTWKYHR